MSLVGTPRVISTKINLANFLDYLVILARIISKHFDVILTIFSEDY